MSSIFNNSHNPDNAAPLYRTVVEQVIDLLCVTDYSGDIHHTVSRNPKLTSPVTLDDYYNRIHPDDLLQAQRSYYRVKSCRTTESLIMQYRGVNDEWLWVECTCILHQEADGTEFVIITMKDITLRKQQEEALRRMAFHDPLTGLPNRRLFEEHLGQAIAHAKRNGQIVALFYLDIDDFKLINDSMGHEVGDLFLISFAKRLKGCIREIDTFARMGGDEFTLLLPIVDSAESVEKVAKRIMESTKKGWDVAGARFDSTVSIGIALYPADGDQPETLMRNVDHALYEVKSSGRNGYRFYQRLRP